MPRKKTYYLNDGTELPGVTSIINRFIDQERLIYWANKTGLEGKTLAAARAEAFGAGKYVHEIFEKVVKRQFDSKKYSKKFVGLAEQLREMLNEMKVRNFLAEMQFISTVHLFGGTPDLIVELDNGENWILDYKFSNSINISNFYQLAAYGILFKENTLRNLAGAKIFWVNKKKYTANGTFEIVPITMDAAKLTEYAGIFVEMNKIYPQLRRMDFEFREQSKGWG